MWCFLGTFPKTSRSSTLRPPFRLLLPLDALEERPEVAAAEALVALALDDLEEERARLRLLVQRGGVLHEDLQQVAVLLVAVDEDLQLPQRLDGLVDALDLQPLQPVRELVV